MKVDVTLKIISSSILQVNRTKSAFIKIKKVPTWVAKLYNNLI
jgi:hypothetical protein